jgi:hypothetical protein
MARKRLSGAQRRAFARTIESGWLRGLVQPGPGKAGRPKGSTARIENRLEQLQKDLAWIGRPDMSALALAKMLQNKPEYRGTYKGLSERVLRRDVAAVQRLIWAPKMRGANILANKD